MPILMPKKNMLQINNQIHIPVCIKHTTVEMPQHVGHSLHECEHLSSNPQNSCKAGHSCAHV